MCFSKFISSSNLNNIILILNNITLLSHSLFLIWYVAISWCVMHFYTCLNICAFPSLLRYQFWDNVAIRWWVELCSCVKPTFLDEAAKHFTVRTILFLYWITLLYLVIPSCYIIWYVAVSWCVMHFYTCLNICAILVYFVINLEIMWYVAIFW